MTLSSTPMRFQNLTTSMSWVDLMGSQSHTAASIKVVTIQLATHGSTKALVEKSEDQVLFRWFDEEFDVVASSKVLSSYYAWCRQKSTDVRYDSARIITHEAAAAKYFING
jgi:hypothetical protein